MKLLEAVELYIRDAGTQRTEQTVLGTRKIARQLVDYCGNRPINQYTSDDLTGFCLGHGGRGVAANTIRTRLSIVRPFFDWVTYQGHISRNPALALKFTVKPGRGGVRKHTWLTKGEVDDVAAAFNIEDPRQHRDLTVFRVTLMLGLRRSEVAALTWESFRRDLSTVSFVGKGSKLAELPVPTALRSALEVWRASQPEGAVLFPSFRNEFDDNGCAHVAADWERPLKGSGIYAIVKAIATRHGLTTLAPHDLRRSFAGIARKQGLTLEELQSLMRHEEVATTARYLKDDPGGLADVAERVSW